MLMTIEQFNTSLERLKPCTVLLAITQGDDDPRIVNHGSGMLLDTAVAEMLVTNGHVYDRFLELREDDPTTRLCMSGAGGRRLLDISPARLLGKDTDPDLATLAISRRDVESQGKRHARFNPWPPRRAAKGMGGFLIGYPNEGLTVAEGEAGVRLLSFGMPIASSSERHFVLHDNNGDVLRSAPVDAQPLTRLWGISGCAVYVWDKSTNLPDGECFLGGFAYQARATETVLVVHADYINSDGTLR
jgi:hypothetical protein